MLKGRTKLLVRALSFLVLIAVIGLIVVTMIRRSRQVQAPPPVRAEPRLSEQIVSITEGYRYLSTEAGKEKFKLLAARDIGYADGRHELEQLDLTGYDAEGRENLRISAARGAYSQETGIATLAGEVKIRNADGLEVATETLAYNQKEEVATSDRNVSFKQRDLSGSAVGAVYQAKTKVLALQKDVQVVNAGPEKGGPPVNVRGARADYLGAEGIIRFTGETTVVQGMQSARADSITGVFNPQTKKLDRVELRGSAILQSQEKGRASELAARDLDFFFDPEQRLKLAAATGAARARSLEPDAPRELNSERIEAAYVSGPEGVALQTAQTQGRTTMKVEPAAGTKPEQAVDRVLEADSVRIEFRPGGKLISRAEAAGQALLVVTPRVVTETAERKRLRAPRLLAAFHEQGNALRSITAEGGAIVEFEPLKEGSKQPKRTMTGRKMTAQFDQTTQEVTNLEVEGDAKLQDGERQAAAARATYDQATQTVALRGQPAVWDQSARTHAEEIDARLDRRESEARGRVRTTYYSRATTGGAAPFKKEKAPVFVTSARAVVRHDEGAARYLGQVRAWQEDNFVGAETVEIDRGERVLQAWEKVESALYDIEREVAAGKKEIVPIFVSADHLIYTDATRTVRYDGAVKVRQGSDRINSAVATAVLDEENRLTRLSGERDVVLTQPDRRATGDRVEYTVATDTAVLTGRPAQVEDRAREVTSKGARLTLVLGDARIEFNRETGGKRARTTHRIQQ